MNAKQLKVICGYCMDLGKVQEVPSFPKSLELTIGNDYSYLDQFLNLKGTIQSLKTTQKYLAVHQCLST